MTHKVGRTWLFGAFAGSAVPILFTVVAAAQEPEKAPDGAPSAAVPAEQTAPNEAAASDDAAELAELKATMQAQKAQIEELGGRLDEAEQKSDQPQEASDEKLQIYGFADFGYQRLWVSKDSPVATAFSGNTGSFVVGNLNLYFDAQPVKRWRTLIEVRFTNAPHGEITGFGGLGGGFQRKTTEQYDPHSATLNAPMWGGYTVIERAHMDYMAFQFLNVRVGNFFTPFGIWNVDHGSPTLISIALPQMIVQKLYPIRQTGLQVYGSTFTGPWELGYIATLTNGRQELANYDFDDDKALGARLFARNDGEIRTQIGLSGYRGNVENRIVNVTSAAPVTFEAEKTLAYNEYALGADLSLDIGRTRIRTEAIMRRQVFDKGKRGAKDMFWKPGSYTPDNYTYDAYAIVAYQLPVLGLEPYAMLEGEYGLVGISDSIASPSLGVNVHFTPATQLKLQGTRFLAFNLRDDSDKDGVGRDPSINNAWNFASRLVMAF